MLIIDETLSVGDIFFQQKSFAKMREIITGGTTCLFVSHDTAAVQNLCQRAILLDKGGIAFYGDAVETVSRYFGTIASGRKRDPSFHKTDQADGEPAHELMSREEIIPHNILIGSKHRHGSGGLEIIAARVTNQTVVTPCRLRCSKN